LHYAVTGLYHYDHRIIEIVARLEHSAHEELEITDAAYLALGALHVEKLGARHRLGRHRGESRQADLRRQPREASPVAAIRRDKRGAEGIEQPKNAGVFACGPTAPWGVAAPTLFRTRKTSTPKWVRSRGQGHPNGFPRRQLERRS
jgi:hypothetical protein